VRTLSRQLAEPDFDFEAGSNMAALLAHLTAAELQLDAAEGWIDALALRFCTTRSLSELLARAGAVHEPFAVRIRDQHNAITALAEQAISHSLAGEPRQAAKSLLSAGARTMNAKLIDMARMVLQRHAAKIADANDLLGMADELRQRYGTGGQQTAPLTGDAGRAAGGIAIRTRDKGEVDAPSVGPEPGQPDAQAPGATPA
jgi:hypothetical protein